MYANTSEAQVVTKGLVSYWSFDRADIDGKTVKDALGNNDGTINGDAQIVKGKIGEALEFDGKDDFVDVGHPADGSFDFGEDKDFSVCAWINVSEPPADQYTIVSKGDRGSNPRILFKIKGNQVYVTFANEPGGGPKPDFTSNTSVIDGRWHYAVLVANRGEATKIYLNGILDAQGIASKGTDLNTESSLFIGKSHQKGAAERRLFKGLIDEVSIYNRALTEAEVKQNFVAEGFAVERLKKLAVTWAEIRKE